MAYTDSSFIETDYTGECDRCHLWDRHLFSLDLDVDDMGPGAFAYCYWCVLASFNVKLDPDRMSAFGGSVDR